LCDAGGFLREGCRLVAFLRLLVKYHAQIGIDNSII
jgi:hypothetical protein